MIQRSLEYDMVTSDGDVRELILCRFVSVSMLPSVLQGLHALESFLFHPNLL
jgi:hypothetical protein